MRKRRRGREKRKQWKQQWPSVFGVGCAFSFKEITAALAMIKLFRHENGICEREAFRGGRYDRKHPVLI